MRNRAAKLKFPDAQQWRKYLLFALVSSHDCVTVFHEPKENKTHERRL